MILTNVEHVNKGSYIYVCVCVMIKRLNELFAHYIKSKYITQKEKKVPLYILRVEYAMQMSKFNKYLILFKQHCFVDKRHDSSPFYLLLTSDKTCLYTSS